MKEIKHFWIILSILKSCIWLQTLSEPWDTAGPTSLEVTCLQKSTKSWNPTFIICTSSIASRPCLSSHTGSSLGCEAGHHRLTSPVTAALWATGMSMPSASLSCENRSCWVLSVNHKTYTGKPTKACSGSDVSHPSRGEASPRCSQKQEAEESEGFLKWRGLVSCVDIVDPIQFSVWAVPASRQENVLLYSDQIRQEECAWNREIFSAWVDRLSSSLFEHLKTMMASLDFQGEGGVSVYTNCDITKMYTGRVSRELVGTSCWHPHSDFQKGNVKACILLHLQSLMDVRLQVKFFSAQLICNYRQVRLSCFANKEK